jgi:PAS domain S-box-containing protein
MSIQDVQRLTYELQVHQLELDMQNDELHRTQSELVAIRDRCADLYDFAPVGYLTLNSNGVILEANHTAAQQLGVDPVKMLGKPLSAFVASHAEDQDSLHLHRLEAFAQERPSTCDLWMERRDGTLFFAQLKSIVRFDSATGSPQWRLALIDLTAQRQKAEEQLAWSAAIVECSHDAIIGTALDGTIITWNAGAAGLYSYTAAEMVGQSICLLMPPEYGEELLRRLATLSAHNALSACYESKGRRKDGKQLDISLTYSPIINRQGSPIGISTIHRDITALKEHEAQLSAADQALRQSQTQLRRLALYQQQLHEQERAAMAREIHDSWAQAFTCLHMDMTWLADQLTTNTEAYQCLQTMLAQLRNLDMSVHHMAMNLHPRLLDDLGLLAAMEWQLEDMCKRTSLQYTLQRPSEDLHLEPTQATVLFRIFQEALSNVIRHAQASQVTVRVEQDPEAVLLTITDNGRGITRKQLRDVHALGLLGMHERARPWGGLVTIKGYSGRGTTVTVRMPYRDAPRPDLSL